METGIIVGLGTGLLGAGVGLFFFQKSYGVGYGIKDSKPLETGKVYAYRFDIGETRVPIIDKVETNGWEWVPVTAKRHAVYMDLQLSQRVTMYRKKEIL